MCRGPARRAARSAGGLAAEEGPGGGGEAELVRGAAGGAGLAGAPDREPLRRPAWAFNWLEAGVAGNLIFQHSSRSTRFRKISLKH